MRIKVKDDDMSLEKISSLLYDSMGLHTESIGEKAILDSIQTRMEECNIQDIEEYYKKISTQSDELKELIEEVVVPETWFFRDNKPFKQLIEFADKEWGAKTSNKPLRILSLPCATGEEPYSIAMTMLDAGFMPSQVEIDALDISKRNIRRCKEAAYRLHSFRGVDKSKRDKFFNRVSDKYEPDIIVRSMVNFSQASILDPAILFSKTPYDVVFCRNLLIYFDTETQLKASRALNKLLTEKGLLFLGHAETGGFLNSWHLSKKYPKAFVVRKFDDSEKPVPVVNNTISSLDKLKNRLSLRKSKGELKPKFKFNNNKVKNPLPSHSNKTEETSQEHTDISLTYAQQQFNNKKYLEAENTCLTLLESNKKDSKIHLLLGELNIETNNVDKATKYFHNVIYLSPGNYDALMHLYRIELNKGNKSQADRLLKRAERSQTRKEV